MRKIQSLFAVCVLCALAMVAGAPSPAVALPNNSAIIQYGCSYTGPSGLSGTSWYWSNDAIALEACQARCGKEWRGAPQDTCQDNGFGEVCGGSSSMLLGACTTFLSSFREN